jgi:hypothetical protein
VRDEPIAPAPPGASLIETVLALALLAGVLVSIGAAFAIGARRLDAGGKTSEALSVARGIVEEMERWSFRGLWSEFGRDGSATAYRFDTRVETRAAGWQQRLHALLPDAWSEIELRSLAPGSPVPALRSTRALRLTVRVSWRDGQRRREVVLCRVRF